MNSTILKTWMMRVTPQHVLVNILTNFLNPIQMIKLQELQIMVHVLSVCLSVRICVCCVCVCACVRACECRMR